MWQGILRDVFATTEEHGCGLLISSRKVPALQFNVVNQAKGPVKVFDILPFEFGQALEVANKITNDSDVINILQDGLARLSHQIIFTPIALELLIEIAEAEREIPGSISEIFERYTDIALGRYDSQKGIEVVFDYFAKKRFLSELAWSEFKCKDRLEMPRTEFDQFLKNYVDRFGWSADSFGVLIEEVERSGILRFNDAVFFSHRSFLDFLVALWVVEHRHETSDYEQQVAGLYFDWVWSEVAIYAVGQARQANSRLLAKIFENQSDSEAVEYHMMKFMIGRLLQAGWHSTSDVKRDGIRQGVSHGEAVFNHFRQSRDADPERIPSIFPVFFLLAFSELAYSSRTLLKEAITILENLPIEESESEFFQRLSLTWAVRNRIESDQASSLVQTAVEHLAVLERNNLLSLEERYSSLVFLTQLGEDDKLLVKPLKRKAQRLARKYPSLKNAAPWLSGRQNRMR